MTRANTKFPSVLFRVRNRNDSLEEKATRICLTIVHKGEIFPTILLENLKYLLESGIFSRSLNFIRKSIFMLIFMYNKPAIYRNTSTLPRFCCERSFEAPPIKLLRDNFFIRKWGEGRGTWCGVQEAFYYSENWQKIVYWN